MTMDVGESMTEAVTSIEDPGMTTAVIMGIMATGSELIIPRLRSFMHRLRRRASASFSHPSLFVPKGIASRRLPSVQFELIRAAVASNAVCHE